MYDMNEDKIINAILDLKGEIQGVKSDLDVVKENMVTKTDHDQVISFFKRMDEERLATVARIDRVEQNFEVQDKTLQSIKTQLKIA